MDARIEELVICEELNMLTAAELDLENNQPTDLVIAADPDTLSGKAGLAGKAGKAGKKIPYLGSRRAIPLG
ncbi:hypothetical protein ACX80U_03735 [Arthrobacter sp. TmT3-37]